ESLKSIGLGSDGRKQTHSPALRRDRNEEDWIPQGGKEVNEKPRKTVRSRPCRTRGTSGLSGPFGISLVDPPFLLVGRHSILTPGVTRVAASESFNNNLTSPG